MARDLRHRLVAHGSIGVAASFQSADSLRSAVLCRRVRVLGISGVWRKPERTFAAYGRSRFLRIYVPFLVWSALYLGFKVVKSRFLPDQPNDYPGIEILWTGSFYHLWFMPFILMVSLAAFVVAKMAQGCEWLRWPVAIGSLVGDSC